MQDLTPGQSIAQRFVVTRRLEPEPGFERWLADDETRGAPATLRVSVGEAAVVSQEARHELQRISQLVHPGMVPCLGLFLHDGHAVCAHAATEGGDLRDWSGRDYREVLTALLPVMSALAYLHDLGMAHGGLNPRAVHITAEGKALLDGTGVATLRAGGGETPNVRGDLQAFGKLLAGLTAIESGALLPEGLSELFTALQSTDKDAPDIHAARRQIAKALQLDEDLEPVAVAVDGASAGPVAAAARTPGSARYPANAANREPVCRC